MAGLEIQVEASPTRGGDRQMITERIPFDAPFGAERSGVRAHLSDLLPSWTRWDTALVVILAGMFALRWAILAPHPIVGADNANYLSTTQKLFGDDPTGMGLLRPPLIGLLLKPFIELLPLEVALKMLGITFSLLIGFPFLKLATRVLKGAHPQGNLLATIATLGFVSSFQYASMLAFGWITFIGIFLILLLILKSMDIWRSPSAGNVVGFALAFFLIAAAHQISFFIAMAAASIALSAVGVNAVRVGQGREVEGYSNRQFAFLMAGVALAALATLPLAPLYLSQSGDLAGDQLPSFALSIENFIKQLDFFFQDAPIVWIVVGWLAITGFLVLVRRGTPLASVWIASLAVVPIIVGLLGMGIAARSLMFTYAPLWLFGASGLAWNFFSLTKDKEGGVAVAGIIAPLAIVGLFAGWQFAGSIGRLDAQAEVHSSIDNAAIEAADWVGERYRQGGAVVAYPFSLGWWLEGVEAVNAYEIGSFQRNAQREQSLTAQAIFNGSHAALGGSIGMAWNSTAGASGYTQTLIRADGEYQTSSYILDEDVLIELAQGDESLRRSLGEAGKEFSLRKFGGTVIGEGVYQLDGLRVTQTTILDEGAGGAAITYSASGASSVRIPLAFDPIFTDKFDADDTSRVKALHVGRNHKFQTSRAPVLVTYEADNAVVSARRLGLNTLVYTIEPLREGESFGITLRLGFDNLRDRGEETRLFDTRQLISERGISAIVADTSPVNNLPPLSEPQLLWLQESAFFQKVFDNERMAVFEPANR